MWVEGVLALLGLTMPMLVHAGCKIESLELPVTMVGSRAVANIGINGTFIPMTVDSGAYFSVLTDAAAAQLNLVMRRAPALRVEGIYGKVDVRTTVVDKLQLLKGEIEGVHFIVGGNEPGAGTMGLIGRNILSVTDTEYDLAHGLIRFHFTNDECGKTMMAYWAGTTPVTEIEALSESRSSQPAIRAEVRLNGKSLTALFDTGATTVVSLQAARQAGVADSEMKPAGTSYGAGRGQSKSWTAAFARFEIGGEAIIDNRLRISDFESAQYDMLLGIDFFLSHRIYVSKKQSKLYVTYNGGPVFSADQRRVASAAAGDAPPAVGGEQPAATNADEFARRGAASAARGDYASALADLNQACALEPTRAGYFAQRGAIQEALRRPAKAVEDFDRALELDPAQVDAQMRRASSRFAAKDRDGAKADLDVLDRTLAPQAQMRLPMSNLYLALDQPALALAQLNQWLPAHPSELKRDVALNNRCWARVLLGIELDKAVGDCDDAVDADAKNPVYLNSRAWAYLRLGKYKNALNDFDRSIAYRPRNALSLYGRGLVKSRLGDTPQGDADLAAARNLQADVDQRLARAGLVPQATNP